jgi:hypothetical protein
MPSFEELYNWRHYFSFNPLTSDSESKILPTVCTHREKTALENETAQKLLLTPWRKKQPPVQKPVGSATPTAPSKT